MSQPRVCEKSKITTHTFVGYKTPPKNKQDRAAAKSAGTAAGSPTPPTRAPSPAPERPPLRDRLRRPRAPTRGPTPGGPAQRSDEKAHLMLARLALEHLLRARAACILHDRRQVVIGLPALHKRSSLARPSSCLRQPRARRALCCLDMRGRGATRVAGARPV